MGVDCFCSRFESSIKLLALEPWEVEFYYDDVGDDAGRMRPDFFRLRLNSSMDLVLWDVYEVEESGPVSKYKLEGYKSIAYKLDGSDHGVFNSLTIIDPLGNHQVISEWELMTMGMVGHA